MTGQEQPRIAYWYLWTDEQGIIRQKRCMMTEFTHQSISPPAAPQWQGRRTSGNMTAMVTVLPPGWTGDWHENPKPQWIIPLSGRWFVESMDGQRVEMGPGEISFGADQHTKECDGKSGHLSGTIGDAPCVLMLVQFDVARTFSADCPFM